MLLIMHKTENPIFILLPVKGNSEILNYEFFHLINLRVYMKIVHLFLTINFIVTFIVVRFLQQIQILIIARIDNLCVHATAPVFEL